MIRLLAALMIALALTATGAAHELRPAFLEIEQTGSERYNIRFKVPARGDARLGLYVRLPSECRTEGPRTERTQSAVVEQFVADCSGGLGGRQISIDGLVGTFTDVVVRAAFGDGAVQAARLTPDQPYFIVDTTPIWLDVARTYFLLGVEHILLGIDHLLFVLALLLLVGNVWMLVKVITAFTVAHSITLALAALGWVQIPQAPVEAVIALSIMFVAAEIVRRTRPENDISGVAPWIFAFAFGLLHGLGFGGALKEIGLPQSDVPLALLNFNLGVEAGQLLFVFAVLGLKAFAARALPLKIPGARAATAYCVGSLAAVWFVQRIAFMI
jgi:hydrogenase/urease accessory protein HupE